MLSPGIATTDPIDVQNRLQKISQMSSYGSLVGYLRINLPTKSINELMGGGILEGLLWDCAAQYQSLPKTFGGSPGKLSDPQEIKNLFEVSKKGNSPNVVIELTNYAYRCVNVFRRDMKFDATESGSVLTVPNMGGAVPIGFGSLLTGTVNTPTVTGDPAYDPTSSISYSEYWIMGPCLRLRA